MAPSQPAPGHCLRLRQPGNLRHPRFFVLRRKASESHRDEVIASPQYYRGLVARKLTPIVWKFAALELCGAPLKTSAFHVISKPSKPAASTTALSSASSRAPAIQPVHKSMLALDSSGTGVCTMMSPIWSLPPGLSTRASSLKAATPIWAEVDHAVGDDHVRPAIIDGQRLSQALAELDVGRPHGLGAPAGPSPASPASCLLPPRGLRGRRDAPR